MSTRGFGGFVVDGVEKIYFRSGDAYPREFGLAVLSWLSDNRDALLHPAGGEVLDRVRALCLVRSSTALVPADIDRIVDAIRGNPNLAHLVDDDPGDGEEVLEYVTYEMDALLQAGVIADASDFPMDSLFCEWGYLIDVDTATFEVYTGVQKGPHDAGRFAHRPPTNEDYYPVALAASWPFTALPGSRQFMDQLGQDRLN